MKRCADCINLGRLVHTIGTCRAVWAPGQDLASPHLMRNWEKRIFSLYTVCYTYICACVSTHMLYRESSRPVLRPVI